MKLVLLPGTQCNNKLWYKLYPQLSPSLQPQHLAIETCISRSAITAMTATAIADKGHLLDFSMGGYFALDFALRYPQKIASLVIIASSAKGLSKAEQKTRAEMIAFVQSHTYRGISQRRIKEFIHQCLTSITLAGSRQLSWPVESLPD